MRDTRSNDYLVEWANDLSVTDTLNTVFGANLSKRTGSFHEKTFDWYAVPSYDRNDFTAFAQADYQPIPRLKLIAGGQVIYGINTGFGKLANVHIAPDRLEQLQVNLIRSHAAGVGEPLPVRVLGEVVYFNASAVKLRTLLKPDPRKDLERVLLVTNR